MKTISQTQALEMLGLFRNIENATSSHSDRAIPNQFILHYENGEIFQSYSSVCGIRLRNGDLYLSNAHDYSVTTSKYVGRWCGLNTKERREGLKNGTITLIM